MDGRITSALERFLRGEMFEFGDPRGALSDPAMISRLESDLPYQFSTFCVYLAVHSYNMALNTYGEAVTEGYSERGFDGIAISLNDRPIDSPEMARAAIKKSIARYHDQIDEGENVPPPSVRLLMVQVKMASRAEMSDLDHLGNSAFRFLANPDYTNELKPNPMVVRWWEIFNELRNGFKENGIPFAPELDLLFIYQGFRLEENALNTAACATSLEILRQHLGHDRVNFTIWRGDEIIDAIALADQAVDGVLEGAHLLELPQSGANGYIGFVAASSIARLIPRVKFIGEKKERPDERVFSDNVRSFTGDNKNNLGAVGLIRTLEDGEGDQLILRHNGVTIVARDARLSVDPSNSMDVTLKGFQIVNGAQSSFILQQHEDLLEGAFIPVKIVITEDEGVKDGVVVGANTQSQVSDYDMLARCPEVRAIQQGFDAVDWNRQDKLWLRRRRGERFPDRVSHRFQILTPRQLLEAFVSAIEKKPHSVHANASKLITRVPSSVFCRDHHPSVYRALGWLVATGRHWAKANGIEWAVEESFQGDPGGSGRKRQKVYRARHHFILALWHLADPNPDDLNRDQGKLSSKLVAVRDRFERVCVMLSDQDAAMALAVRAAEIVDSLVDDESELPAQVRKKDFTERLLAKLRS